MEQFGFFFCKTADTPFFFLTFGPSPVQRGPAWDTPWVAVDVTLRRRLARPIPLEELKRSPDPAVQSLTLLRQARLSVHRLTEEQWHAVLALEGGPPA